VWDFVNEAAHRSVVWTLDNLIELRQANASDNQLVRFRARDKAAVILNPNHAAAIILFLVLLCHLSPRQSSNIKSRPNNGISRLMNL
jgi:hypothetical protein